MYKLYVFILYKIFFYFEYFTQERRFFTEVYETLARYRSENNFVRVLK